MKTAIKVALAAILVVSVAAVALVLHALSQFCGFHNPIC